MQILVFSLASGGGGDGGAEGGGEGGAGGRFVFLSSCLVNCFSNIKSSQYACIRCQMQGTYFTLLHLHLHLHLHAAVDSPTYADADVISENMY